MVILSKSVSFFNSYVTYAHRLVDLWKHEHISQHWLYY